MFSDETGGHTGGRHFIVAGFVFDHYRKWNRLDLIQAENVSLKGKKDWHQTKNLAQRVKYIEVVLRMGGISGRVFYNHYADTSKEFYWQHTVDTLCAAMARFTDGRTAIVYHQGLNGGSRDRMKKDLRARGHDVHVRPAAQDLNPEVRLADALCGYLGICCDPSHDKIDAFPAKPDWFIDLNENALPQQD